MTNKLISSTIRALRKTPFLVSLLFFLFTGLTANSQTYEFETHLRSEKSTSLHIYKLIIDQSSGTVKVTYELFIPSFLDSIEDVDLDSTKIREIGINENSEIVIVDSNNEAVVGVYVNNTGTNGYFIYKSKE
ncbi:MAG: hypothetical protein K2K00_01825, partial [Muribaculaceae bacterium]|nr:hypothetical protein [Muribaculaceae bacterium]